MEDYSIVHLFLLTFIYRQLTLVGYMDLRNEKMRDCLTSWRHRILCPSATNHFPTDDGGQHPPCSQNTGEDGNFQFSKDISNGVDARVSLSVVSKRPWWSLSWICVSVMFAAMTILLQTIELSSLLMVLQNFPIDPSDAVFLLCLVPKFLRS